MVADLSRPPRLKRRLRRGFTLPELLIATAIVAMMSASLGGLVYAAAGAANRTSAARQSQHHGRRSAERLTELIRLSKGSRQFPGSIVVTTTTSGTQFSDVLALWIPLGNAVDPTGRPRVRELLFISSSPTEPTKLMQYRRVADASTAPAWNDSTGWAALADAVKSDPASTTEVWTDLLHWNAYGTTKRGNLHFVATAKPSNADWQEYLDGTKTWNQLSWGVYGGGSLSGVRVVQTTFEFHLQPPLADGATLGAGDRGVFFGAATIKTVVEK